MKSRSKYQISNEDISKIFLNFGVKDIGNIEALSAGEYNSIYDVTANGKHYILKVSPHKNFKRLTYENNMMQAEVFWYSQIREHTDIDVPEIYFTDFSKSIIPADYFIMEKVQGIQKDNVKYSKEDKAAADSVIVRQVAQLHAVHNDKFGYVQGEKFDTWYEAYCSIITNLLDDYSKVGKTSKKGQKILKYAKKYKHSLNTAECSMVNTDCWDSNIIAVKKNGVYDYVWIDPERSIWGDKILDFACLDAFTPLEDKKSVLKEYNSIAYKKVMPDDDEKIRYAFAKGMMALILQVEKYYRYTPLHKGWWRNVIASQICYSQALKALK